MFRFCLVLLVGYGYAQNSQVATVDNAVVEALQAYYGSVGLSSDQIDQLATIVEEYITGDTNAENDYMTFIESISDAGQQAAVLNLTTQLEGFKKNIQTLLTDVYKQYKKGKGITAAGKQSLTTIYNTLMAGSLNYDQMWCTAQAAFPASKWPVVQTKVLKTVDAFKKKPANLPFKSLINAALAALNGTTLTC